MAEDNLKARLNSGIVNVSLYCQVLAQMQKKGSIAHRIKGSLNN